MYQVALVVKHVLPATLSLKHLLFHLAHLGGKVILPAPLFPVTTAVTFAQTVRDAFQRAVAAEKEYTMQHQKIMLAQRRQQQQQQQGDAETQEVVPVSEDFSLSLAALYSPYAKCDEDLQGPAILQDSLGTFLYKNRGIFSTLN